MTGTEAFGPDRRLPNKAAFDHVFAAPDIRLRKHPFSILARHRDGDARLGMVIGKRHARHAVDRNRIRRILRDRFRRSALRGLDIIVLARVGAGDVESPVITESILWVLDRLDRDQRSSPPVQATP